MLNLMRFQFFVAMLARIASTPLKENINKHFKNSVFCLYRQTGQMTDKKILADAFHL